MMSLKFLILSLFPLLYPVLSYKTGAPVPACKTMAPSHKDAEPQTVASPYKVMLNTTRIRVNETLEITLTSDSGQEEFKGFLIQVQNVSAENAYVPGFAMGMFMDPENDDARVLHCNNNKNNAMTHKSPDAKKQVVLYWIPTAPGLYRVFSTFAKDYSTFWVKKAQEDIIEVMSEEDGSETEPDTLNLDELCSDLKLKPEATPITTSGNPYQLSIGHVQKMKGGNDHTIYQKGLLWVNVSSEYGTPIKTLFMEIRKPKNPSKSYGKFLMMKPMGKSKDMGENFYKLLDCFGGKENAVLYMNKGVKTVSDVSFQWEAPHDETGEFEVIGSVMNAEDDFWNTLGEDKEKGKIRVVKASGEGSSGSARASSTTSTGKNKKNSVASMIPFIPLYFLCFVSFFFKN